MISSEMKNAKPHQRKDVKAFVRKNNAPLLPAPPSEVGFKGWLYQNVFQSMSDFSSVSASIRSALIAVFTFFLQKLSQRNRSSRRRGNPRGRQAAPDL